MKSNTLLSLIGAFLLTVICAPDANAQAISKMLLNEDFNQCIAPPNWNSLPDISEVVHLSYTSNAVKIGGGTMATPEFNECIVLFDDYIGQSEAKSGTRCLETDVVDLSNPKYFNATLGADWLLSKEGGNATFSIDGWDGSQWVRIYSTVGVGKGMWSSMDDPDKWTLDFTNPDFRARFCYNEPTVQWNNGLGIDNVTIEVQELIGGGSSLPCNDNLNISADINCLVGLTPDIYLEGVLSPGLTYDDFTIYIDTIDNPGIADAVRATNNTSNVLVDLSLVPDFRKNGMYGPVIVNVIETATGLPCWGYAMFEGKLPPTIDPVEDITVSCLVTTLSNGNPDPIVTGMPEVSDTSCVDGVIDFTDDISLLECSDLSLTTRVVTRIFTITSPKGMSVLDTQLITVAALDESLLGPTPIIVLTCGEGDTPQDIADHPDYDMIDAYPHVDDSTGLWILRIGEAQCNTVSTYDDSKYINACSGCGPEQGTVKFVRKWTILNWCNGSIMTRNQVIKKVDDVAPVIDNLPSIVYAATNAWSCEVDVDLPVPLVTDNCDNAPTILEIVGVAENGEEIVIEGLTALHVPPGYNEFTYYSTDCCGNIGEEYLTVFVKDVSPPVAIAKEFIVVSLTDSGIEGDETGVAKLFAHHIDNNSYDNCGPVHLEIRRDHDAPYCLNVGDSYYDEDNNLKYHNNNITYNGYETYPDGNPVALHLEDSEYDTDRGEYVKFCCEDLNSANYDVDGDGELDYGYVKVWLRVWDDANLSGEYSDIVKAKYKEGAPEEYNYNGDLFTEVWAYVKVEDKRVPVIIPDDVTIYCDDDIDWIVNKDSWTDVEPGGYNEYNENIPAPYIENTLCANYILQYKDTLVDLNSCNVGHFVRAYRLLNLDSTIVFDKDWNPVHAYQWVNIDLTLGDITFDWDPIEEGIQPYPEKVYSWNSCFLTDDDVVLPEIDGIVCDVLGRKITIEEYDVGQGGGCKKWYVTYDYINWCEDCYDDQMQIIPDRATLEGMDYGYAFRGCSYDGLYHEGIFHTIYKFEDTIAPVVVVGCDTTITGAIDASCETSIVLTPEAEDNSDCNLDLRWTVRVVGDDNDYDWYDTGLGSAPTFTVTSLLPGHYRVYYEVLDACDNLGKCEAEIWIDGKAPTPYCVSLHTAVMVDGSVTLWAKDFDRGSFSNCVDSHLFFTFNNRETGAAEHPNVDLLYQEHYFYGLGEVFVDDTEDYELVDDTLGLAAYLVGEAQLWNPDAYSSSRYFSCLPVSDPLDNIYAPNVIEMRVWDLSQFTPGSDKGSDFCIITLDIQDHQGVCGGASAQEEISGFVKTIEGEGVDQVKMSVSAEAPEYPRFTLTDEGDYKFANIDDGLTYELMASKEGEFDNGASTLDLVMIQRHILGLSKFDSGYKMIAADVNNDELIKASDLVELRKLILGVNDSFTNLSWRFVVADQPMNDENPWPFKEMEVVSDFSNPVKVDFIGVKIGDVNGDVDVHGITNANVKPRSKGITFTIEDKKVAIGEVLEIEVTAKNFEDIYGYQFTSNTQGLKYIDIKAGAIDVSNENVGVLSNEAFTMSWIDPQGISFEEDDVLFVLRFEAQREGALSEMVNINSTMTTAESYIGENLNVASVELEIRGQDNGQFILYQNEPNPFNDQTNILFEMPQKDVVELKIYDVTGKQLFVKTIEANKGLNQVVVKQDQLNASGVMYYQIESDNFTQTKKMIIFK